jgi:membrane-associated phospholipid phosphatase
MNRKRITSLAVTAAMFAATLFATTLPATSSAAAQNAPAYELKLEVDLPVLAIAATVAIGWVFARESTPPACGPECARNRLWFIDKPVTGMWSPTWSLISDVTVASTFVGAALVLALSEPLGNAANDAIVVAEAAVSSIALAIMSNTSVRRPRPFAYGTDAPLEERLRGNAALSFFSGHTAGSFATTWATFHTLRRIGRHTAAWITLIGGLCLASFVGIGRVLAGQHFPTDVLAGAVVGTGVGFLVPALHDHARVSIAQDDTSASIVVSGVF